LFFLFSVILVITAMIVFASNTTDSGLTYGSAFYLPLPSSVSAIVAAYVVFRAKKSHVSHGYSPIDFESARTSVWLIITLWTFEIYGHLYCIKNII
jgi:hypothetical protein